MAKKKETGITTATKTKKTKVVETVEEKIISDIIESEKVEDKIVSDTIEKEEKIEEQAKKYLQCPFCGVVDYTLNGRDPTSSWCKGCGKCYPAIWKS